MPSFYPSMPSSPAGLTIGGFLDENSRLVKPFLETSPKKNNVYVTPMVVLTEPPEEGAEVTVVAE